MPDDKNSLRYLFSKFVNCWSLHNGMLAVLVLLSVIILNTFSNHTQWTDKNRNLHEAWMSKTFSCNDLSSTKYRHGSGLEEVNLASLAAADVAKITFLALKLTQNLIPTSYSGKYHDITTQSQIRIG